MPVPRDETAAIARRLGWQGAPEELAARLAPTPESERAIPSEVPAVRDSTTSGRDQRLEFLRAQGAELPHLTGRVSQMDPAAFRRNIQQFIRTTPIPTSLIRP